MSGLGGWAFPQSKGELQPDSAQGRCREAGADGGLMLAHRGPPWKLLASLHLWEVLRRHAPCNCLMLHMEMGPLLPLLRVPTGPGVQIATLLEGSAGKGSCHCCFC